MAPQNPTMSFRPVGEHKKNMARFCKAETRNSASALDYLTKLGLKAHKERLKNQ